MRKVLTGLMGLGIALTFAGSAWADGWHHHHHAPRAVYYRPAPTVAFYAAPPRAYYPAPAPCFAPAPVVAAPYVPFGVGYQSRRFSFFLGY